MLLKLSTLIVNRRCTADVKLCQNQMLFVKVMQL